MISIQKKFLFIHIPKTGGNSIQNVLKDYSEDKIVTLSDYQDGIERFEVRNSKYEITKHSTLLHYKSVLGKTVFHSLFKFGTIRNPWDMMISFYFSPHRGKVKWNRSDFLTLIKKIKTIRYFICDKSAAGKRSPKLDNNINFLIRFERLNDDFKIICNQLDIQPIDLPKRNQSNHKHYSKYYDDELKEIVRKKFFEEIEFGEYNFDKV